VQPASNLVPAQTSPVLRDDAAEIVDLPPVRKEETMSMKLFCPILATLALFVAGCEEGTTRKDVAKAEKKVLNEQQDVDQAKADANVKIAAQKDDVEKTRRETMKPVIEDSTGQIGANEKVAAEQKDVDKTKADANAAIQKEQTDVQGAKEELQDTKAKFKQTEERDAFATQVDQQLATADQRIDQLKKDKDAAKDAAAKQPIQDKIDKLQAQRDRVKDALGEMKKADVLKWQDHQKNVQTQSAELDKLLQDNA